MKENKNENSIVSEENIDGLFNIMKGIEMLYDLDIDERNKVQDRLELVKRMYSNNMKALTLTLQKVFATSLADIYIGVTATCEEILGIEEDD